MNGNLSSGFRGYGIAHRTGRQGCINTNIPAYGFDVELTDVVRLDGREDDCNRCTLKIFKDNEAVFERTEDECPEVENLNNGENDGCEFSDRIEVVRFEKLPYLHRAEVVDYAYDVRLGLLADSDNYGFLLTKKEIPDECLNIYKNNITSLIPSRFNFIANTPENGYQLVAQICSDPDCPPPEYEVICDCNEECPSDTCAVECNGVICCYDPNRVCRDNSKFIINCVDKAEAEHMCNKAIRLIDNRWLESPPRVFFSERKGQAVSVDFMSPTSMEYFESGQQNTIPNWRVRVTEFE